MIVHVRRAALAGVLVLAAACDSPTEPVRLSVPALTLEAVGDSKQLEATVVGSDRLPVWESLDPGIVTVTRAGMVTAVAAGTTTVRATVGSQTAVGTVTVLPPVDVALTSASLGTNAGTGDPKLTLQLRNDGGRGFFRIEAWRARQTPDGEHTVVVRDLTDLPAPVGMDISSSFVGAFIADAEWVVVYSREPASLGYRMTGCVRLDGGSPCPVP